MSAVSTRRAPYHSSGLARCVGQGAVEALAAYAAASGPRLTCYRVRNAEGRLIMQWTDAHSHDGPPVSLQGDADPGTATAAQTPPAACTAKHWPARLGLTATLGKSAEHWVVWTAMALFFAGATHLALHALGTVSAFG